MTSNPDLPAAPAARPAARPVRRRLYAGVIALAVLVVIGDQLTKLWAVSTLADGQVVPVIGEFISFQLTYNPGAAFSIGEEFTWILAIIAAAAVVGITWYARRVDSIALAIALGLVLGGAITHLGDRLFREPGFARGHVVDFINYGNFFIGNVADIALVAGASLFAIVALLGARPKAGDSD